MKNKTSTVSIRVGDLYPNSPDRDQTVKIDANMASVLHEAFAAFRRTEHRQEMWRSRHVAGFYEEGITEQSVFPDDRLRPAEDAALQNVEAQILCDALKTLQSEHRRRITAYYFNGQTMQQIAESEGIAKSSVCRSLAIALKKLKRILENDATKGL